MLASPSGLSLLVPNTSVRGRCRFTPSSSTYFTGGCAIFHARRASTVVAFRRIVRLDASDFGEPIAPSSSG
jgi:putative component of membrane protein insertase Oxa1/YidC/SpoIIIJ protein YidD